MDSTNLDFAELLIRLSFQIFSDGCEQPAKALQRLLVGAGQQLLDAAVHDPGSQHLELVQLTDEANVAEGPLARLHLLLLPVGLDEGE